MATYTFRCPEHGDFQVEQPMERTTPTHYCTARVKRPAGHDPVCAKPALKVLGGAIQFTYGRQNFHDGPDGTGETVRETGQRWEKEYESYHGRKPEPIGERWI